MIIVNFNFLDFSFILLVILSLFHGFVSHYKIIQITVRDLNFLFQIFLNFHQDFSFFQQDHLIFEFHPSSYFINLSLIYLLFHNHFSLTIILMKLIDFVKLDVPIFIENFY
jgi:hypothetical protein